MNTNQQQVINPMTSPPSQQSSIDMAPQQPQQQQQQQYTQQQQSSNQNRFRIIIKNDTNQTSQTSSPSSGGLVTVNPISSQTTGLPQQQYMTSQHQQQQAQLPNLQLHPNVQYIDSVNTPTYSTDFAAQTMNGIHENGTEQQQQQFYMYQQQQQPPVQSQPQVPQTPASYVNYQRGRWYVADFAPETHFEHPNSSTNGSESVKIVQPSTNIASYTTSQTPAPTAVFVQSTNINSSANLAQQSNGSQQQQSNNNIPPLSTNSSTAVNTTTTTINPVTATSHQYSTTTAAPSTSFVDSTNNIPQIPATNNATFYNTPANMNLPTLVSTTNNNNNYDQTATVTGNNGSVQYTPQLIDQHQQGLNNTTSENLATTGDTNNYQTHLIGSANASSTSYTPAATSTNNSSIKQVAESSSSSLGSVDNSSSSSSSSNSAPVSSQLIPTPITTTTATITSSSSTNVPSELEVFSELSTGKLLNESGIHSRIELAMDLVKTHLASAVREEMLALKNQIKQLNELCSKLELENQLLKQNVSPETLKAIESRLAANANTAPPASSSLPSVDNNATTTSSLPHETLVDPVANLDHHQQQHHINHIQQQLDVHIPPPI